MFLGNMMQHGPLLIEELLWDAAFSFFEWSTALWTDAVFLFAAGMNTKMDYANVWASHTVF